MAASKRIQHRKLYARFRTLSRTQRMHRALTTRHSCRLAFAVGRTGKFSDRFSYVPSELSGPLSIDESVYRYRYKYVTEAKKKCLSSVRKRRCIKKWRRKPKDEQRRRSRKERKERKERKREGETAENCEAIAINCTQALSSAFYILYPSILVILVFLRRYPSGRDVRDNLCPFVLLSPSKCQNLTDWKFHEFDWSNIFQKRTNSCFGYSNRFLHMNFYIL